MNVPLLNDFREYIYITNALLPQVFPIGRPLRPLHPHGYQGFARLAARRKTSFKYFVVKNDHSLVTFNYSISHLQLTVKNSQI